jgi:hypothetical protein
LKNRNEKIATDRDIYAVMNVLSTSASFVAKPPAGFIKLYKIV